MRVRIRLRLTLGRSMVGNLEGAVSRLSAMNTVTRVS